MALAAALARDDVQVAYICLVPAVNVYANAGVPIKIVAGTHEYGYGLVVDPAKVKTIEDLENEGIRIGCVQVGGAADVLLNKTIEKYGLDKDRMLGDTKRIRRMNPAKMILAIQTGQLDAAFMPEQWATMTEDFGFEMLLTAQDIWPHMQGSVLVVKQDLIDNQPQVVEKLVKVSAKATDWLNKHPEQAAEIMAEQLQIAGTDILPEALGNGGTTLEITPEALLRSMARIDYTTDIDAEKVQDVIDYMAELDYIKSSFPASDILDLSFLND
jgi:NitT/TauT family transport system substrate-binding protein